ncbi:MAG: hypothetical protein Q9162_006944 [Coniocarpon cinnabarinum]
MPKHWDNPYAPLQSSLLIEGPSTPPNQQLLPANLSSIPHRYPSGGAKASPPASPLVRSPRRTHLPLLPPPSKPIPWLWQCHHCRHTYPLGATRRCLDDGHVFCSGEAHTTKNVLDMWNRRYMRKTKACASEFDYEGWRAWNRWRELRMGEQSKEETGHDCWRDCSYPSECKWSGKIVAVKETKEEKEDFEVDVADVATDEDDEDLEPRLKLKRATSLAAMDVDEGYATDEERELDGRLREAYGKWENRGEMDVDDESERRMRGQFGAFSIL